MRYYKKEKPVEVIKKKSLLRRKLDTVREETDEQMDDILAEAFLVEWDLKKEAAELMDKEEFLEILENDYSLAEELVEGFEDYMPFLDEINLDVIKDIFGNPALE